MLKIIFVIGVVIALYAVVRNLDIIRIILFYSKNMINIFNYLKLILWNYS